MYVRTMILKCKHVVLSVETKSEVLKKLENGNMLDIKIDKISINS